VPSSVTFGLGTQNRVELINGVRKTRMHCFMWVLRRTLQLRVGKHEKEIKKYRALADDHRFGLQISI
jgi:hypothetical protein